MDPFIHYSSRKLRNPAEILMNCLISGELSLQLATTKIQAPPSSSFIPGPRTATVSRFERWRRPVGPARAVLLDLHGREEFLT